MQMYDYLFKIAVIGDISVGKTSLSNRVAKNIYKNNYEATVGVEFNSIMIDVNDKKIKFHIWDTCGQEEFKSLTTNYYRSTSGIIIVYDITNRNSFKHLESWMRSVDAYCHKNVNKIIIGNKIDLQEHRQVSFNEGCEFANNHNALFYEISSKDSINTSNIFISMGEIILDSIEKKLIETTPQNGIKIYTKYTEPKKECCMIQ